MRAIWDNMLHSLEIVASVGSVVQNYVVTKIIEKVEQLGREKPATLGNYCSKLGQLSIWPRVTWGKVFQNPRWRIALNPPKRN